MQCLVVAGVLLVGTNCASRFWTQHPGAEGAVIYRSRGPVSPATAIASSGRAQQAIGSEVSGRGKRTGQRIPRRIVMSYRVQDEIPPQIFELWHRLNPEWEMVFFDDATALRFIKKHFDRRHVRFFESLTGKKQGAYRGDFFRYCYLLRRGGVWADVDLRPLRPVESFLHPEATFFSVAHTHNLKWNHVYQAYIGAVPGQPLLQAAIEAMIAAGPGLGIDFGLGPPYEGTPCTTLHKIVSAAIAPKKIVEGIFPSPGGLVQLLNQDQSNDPPEKTKCLRPGEPCSVCSGTTAVADCRYPASVWERDGVGFHKSALSKLDMQGGVAGS